ncbi:transposase IS116/IS110/IS902 family protein [Rhodovulum sulfidophilum]|uniref:Transposase IS116/IS110/IS902 family protein n=1 Tax=Rhodovulum sulfidophilum TaxID=35806 RepID=A0A0D6B3C4_RHOSU|nr:transposase IS116/IS110/IS902 family protein [Rhodovulum sulfidophilum]
MCAKKTGSIEDLAVVGVDIGKDTFHLVGFDRSGQVVLRKQIKRLALDATFEKLPRCVVGMEACLSAHFVSRRLRDMGFDPRIIPAIYVKPFNKGQLNLQALHRVRARLVSRRTATINQIRAFLIEQGIAVRSGLRALRNSFEAILEQRRDEISARMRSILIGLYGDWLWLDDRIAAVSTEIEEISRTEENEPPRLARRAKLSKDALSWTARRTRRAHTRPSSANGRCRWSSTISTAMRA